MTQLSSLLLLLGTASASVSFFGHPAASYFSLQSELDGMFSHSPCSALNAPTCAADPSCAQTASGCVSRGNSTHTCVIHSALALNSVSKHLLRGCDRAVLLGVAPSSEHLLQAPTLALLGTMDGVTRTSNFAVSRHRYAGASLQFGLIDGASHHSFTDVASGTVAAHDLQAQVSHQHVHRTTAAIVRAFLVGGGAALHAAEQRAARVSKPLTDALLLEGSAALGHPVCNSDHPTNPSCAYPSWPAHSLPPGAAPAPSPALPPDCVCGSTWVSQHANPLIAGLDLSQMPAYTSFANDAFADVSDTHPFHLPHVWNKCDGTQAACALNLTTLTMPVLKAGHLFPNASSTPVSAFELKSKMKSREAVWEAAGFGPQDDSKTDKNNSMCKVVNQAAYDWALAHADPSVKAQFLQHGEPFVIVDDKPAPIGVTGPSWIKDELVYTRTGGTVQVQSWQFVVKNTNQGSVPWFFPVGMHYCKLLSPARAMEWIYTDGLRANLAA
eukprot:TRINITY_DN2218_c0_g1_i1.p1 TRINITY_DN2218_c0_g1~~TRINITY_DN2218_c0_g1_i1.p1  ORF type:complete len:497 (-),score=100.11 TRINITY_DN2218_c0_g1_i1:145-1635(-)